MTTDQPPFYAGTLRLLIRFAIVMAVFGTLIGIAYQESAHKLPLGSVPLELHQAAVLPLALVHGHVFTIGVLLPLALAGALVLSLRAGGRPVSQRALAWLTRGFLPFAAATVVLQLVKGYFILLSVRNGLHDLAAVDAGFLGGVPGLRYAIYALVHSGMGVSLVVFLVLLWRSLGHRQPA